jgi:hypothetical protein
MLARTFWSRSLARKSSPTSPPARRARPRLEGLEDRTLPAVGLLWDAAAGDLYLRAGAGDHIVRETVNAAGFLEVAFDGQRHSSDPNSAFFDPALAGAGTLTGIRFDGGSGHDTLTLGSQTLAGGLTVLSDADVLTQDVTAAGPLTIQAPTITVGGTLHASGVTLDGSDRVTVEAAGLLAAGRIDVSAGTFVNTGQVHAVGPAGGQVAVDASKVLDAGPITADATAPGGDGGTVRITFTGAYLDTAAAVTSADGGVAGQGGWLTIDGGATGHLFSSGRLRATGAAGGAVDLLGRAVVLDGAAVDASGGAGGGSVRLGGDYQGSNPTVTNAQTVTVTAAATLRADALGSGSGGRVVVWADQDTHFDGAASARGGPGGGAGGFLEVSGKGSLTYGGTADAGAPAGPTGTLLLDPKNLIISAAPAGVFPQYDLLDPHPTAGGAFGTDTKVLSNGNVVVTNPKDNFGGTSAGAVYLFDGQSGALISSLVGSNPNDQLGLFGVTVLSNGNYLILSPHWNADRGAVTWVNAGTGISGTVSDANSLVGSTSQDDVGLNVKLLSNGNYLVLSPNWNSSGGAVTWGNAATGISGTVSAANSLVGNANDHVGGVLGGSTITLLSNGNYVVQSSAWNAGRGAATWGNGSTGVAGTVSASNSLVGTNPFINLDHPGDRVGQGVTALSNGNYVVAVPRWNGNMGAATWGNGSTGVTGTISAANSLVGSNPGDYVGGNFFGDSGVRALTNGNYVVVSPSWHGGGAVTWGNGSTGVTGTVSDANSLVGIAVDPEGTFGIIALTNGNYVVLSPDWNLSRGAATWGNGSTGTIGTVSAANSLVGSNGGGIYFGDRVGFAGFPLSNGNYVVLSTGWNQSRGAVTWGNGSTGTAGVVSDANSLVGSDIGDEVGILANALSNGNYVVASPDWNGARGAVTWGDGLTGVSGVVSAANSLVGSHGGGIYFGDMVGGFDGGTSGLVDGIFPLSNRRWAAASR